jgi:hypothetical protein
MHSAEICYAEPDLAKSDGPVSKIGGSGISKNSNDLRDTTTVNLDDWRTPLVHYLENPNHVIDRKVRQQALKFVLLDNTLDR